MVLIVETPGSPSTNCSMGSSMRHENIFKRQFPHDLGSPIRHFIEVAFPIAAWTEF